MRLKVKTDASKGEAEVRSHRLSEVGKTRAHEPDLKVRIQQVAYYE